MKIILSRKGFDSTAGGCPSPIFPDGSMVSLPIPSATSGLRYDDLRWRDRKLSDIVNRLNGAKPKPHDLAHLDPDLVRDSRPRASGWRPLFGQDGSPQGHLREQGVGSGDLFLFFGLFRDVDSMGRFIRLRKARHVIWGWLQIDRVLTVDDHLDELGWAGDHPHVGRERDPSNTLYVARTNLALAGHDPNGSAIPGGGVFENFDPRLQLTDPDAKGHSLWRLPIWFMPTGRPPLSYHRRLSRWTSKADHVTVQSVGRGQEFVLDTKYYPETTDWVLHLLKARG